MESRPQDPWQLEDVSVQPDGLLLSGTLDVRDLTGPGILGDR